VPTEEITSAPRKPLAAPPSWLPLLEPADSGGGLGPGNEGPFPGEGWPKLETIDYASKLIVLVLLLLALPWLVSKLLTHPGELPRHSASLVGAPGSVGA
jgi:hypothetical protein